MGLCKKLTTVTALAVLVLAVYYGSYRVPDGTTIAGHITVYGFQLMLDVYKLAGWLGLGEPMLLLKEHFNLEKSEIVTGIETQDLIFNGVPVRVYTPVDANPGGAGVIYFHGGGWVVGTVDGYNELVSNIAKGSRLVIVSVDYRLAPEHVFPAAFDDCVKATNYFLNHATELKVDPKRVAVAGDSAGGNLAAAVSLKLEKKLKAQVLIYPALQAFDLDTPSYQVTGPKGSLLTKSMMASFWLYYAQGNIKNQISMMNNNHTSSAIKQSIAGSYVNVNSLSDQYVPKEYIRGRLDFGDTKLWKELQGVLLNPFYAPLAAPDVSTVPQALILTAEYDVLRDDGILYFQQLKQAGVEVSHYHSEDGIHGMVSVLGRHHSQSSEKMFNTVIDFLTNKL